MSSVVTVNRNRIEFRKEVWRTIRQFGILSVTELDMRYVQNHRKGGYFYEDEKAEYCDGRSKPEQFFYSLVSRRMIVFLPFEESSMTMTSNEGPLAPKANDQPLTTDTRRRFTGGFVTEPMPSHTSPMSVAPVSDPDLVLADNTARNLDGMGRPLD